MSRTIQAKFNINEEVFFMGWNGVYKGRILNIQATVHPSHDEEVTYLIESIDRQVDHVEVPENLIAYSKKGLAESLNLI